jgi:hypothetical protein
MISAAAKVIAVAAKVLSDPGRQGGGRAWCCHPGDQQDDSKAEYGLNPVL